MDLSTLPALTVLSDNVTIVEHEGVKLVRVIHDKANAAILLFWRSYRVVPTTRSRRPNLDEPTS